MTTAQPDWRRPAHCTRNACIEVAAQGEEVLIRDGKSPAGAVQRYSRDEFARFIEAAKAGQYDDLT